MVWPMICSQMIIPSAGSRRALSMSPCAASGRVKPNPPVCESRWYAAGEAGQRPLGTGVAGKD